MKIARSVGKLRPREEGTGGRDGVVLNMSLSGDGIWNAVYSIEAFVGKDRQRLMLSVDTGSSDIWLASNSCSTSECDSAHTPLYDPLSAAPTGQSANITYLRGAASGPIVWDTFKIGPYTLPSQALVAANQVTNEALSSDFVGLIGLALPPNSEIAQKIAPTETDSPDGATLQQNLFGLTPDGSAPEQRFFGISLARPGSSRIASLLTIGRHPSQLYPGFDPSNVSFIDLIPSGIGDTYWRVPLTSITAWVQGVPRPVSLTKSAALKLSYPVAIVDTGGSGIIATKDIANGIYGAWSIGPGEDGKYYVPCTTPLNLTVGLGLLPPISMHPLDITAIPPMSPESSDPSTCLGVIQASDSLESVADIVLGVPFLRNVYTVLSSSASSNASSPSSHGSKLPRLGLLGLTDPATAMDEFHSVRVLGQPLDPSTPPTHDSTPVTVGNKLSVGVIVLLAIVGFFLACMVLFVARWWIMRTRFRREEVTEDITRREHKRQSRDMELDEDTLRSKRWEGGKKRGWFDAEGSTGSDWTRVDQGLTAEDRDVPQREEDDTRPASHSRCRSPSNSSGSDVDIGHGSQDLEANIHVEVDGEGGWSRGVPAPDLTTVALLRKGEDRPWSADGATLFGHDRQSSSSSAAVTFQDDLGMAGVGARGSVASSWNRVPRPKGARAMSHSSNLSSMEGRTWSIEVGQILDYADRPWPAKSEKG